MADSKPPVTPDKPAPGGWQDNSPPPLITRKMGTDTPGGRTPDDVLYDYYRGERTGYTKNGVIQRPARPGD